MMDRGRDGVSVSTSASLGLDLLFSAQIGHFPLSPRLMMSFLAKIRILELYSFIGYSKITAVYAI